MRFKTDENLPVEAAAVFRKAGHEAETIHDEQLSGRPDDQLAEVCRRENRILVTLDLDFADIRTYPPHEYPGLIVLRPRLQAKRRVLDLLQFVSRLLDLEPLAGHLWIVDESRVRIRRGKPGTE